MSNDNDRRIDSVESELKKNPKVWLVTGAAGFVGSNLCEHLLSVGQKVVGLDNFITGQKSNIKRLEDLNSKFTFFEQDIRDIEGLEKIVVSEGVELVSHQAALGSVPRSIDNPLASHDHNVNGFLNVIEVCRRQKLKLVYASSSSVYGDSPNLPKVEEETGNVLSPYAATKYIDEIYAGVYSRVYGLDVKGLRYFNVFGPHQNPDGVYAAVIPKWFEACLKGESPRIFGDGETSRDFCFVKNAVQANILALMQPDSVAGESPVYNIAAEKRITLNELISGIQSNLKRNLISYKEIKPVYEDFRAGDVRHSLADTSKAKRELGYVPEFSVEEGLSILSKWYAEETSYQATAHHI